MEQLLGLFWLLLFIGGPIFIGGYLGKKYGPGRAAKRRDEQIEIAMRLAIRDAEAQERAAQRIQTERGF